MGFKKTLLFIVSFALLVQMLSLRAYAYIDVSATTYLVQIIAGIVVVGGTIAGVAISSFKKKLKDKTGIDLEHKEHEDDIVVYDDDNGEKSE